MWTSLIFLSLAFTQIYGQGFQLFFGTTQGITECKDKLPNCFAFKKDSCKAPYEKWAHDYCPLYCGFCQGPPTPAPACEDTKSDCDSYQKSVCTDDVYRQWSYDNCRYYCRLCTPAQLALKDSQITTLPPALCVDKLDDCKLYGKDSCTGEYSGWAKENCRRFCGFCVGLPTPAPPCRDVIPNCNRYQKNTCTDIKYKGWAEENCNKFCGFCSDGSSSGNQPSVTSAPTFAPPFPQASGTMAPPLPGGKRRNLGAGSSASEGNNVFFGTDKPKATQKPTPAPTTTTPAPTTTTQAPTTTTPQPTTTTEAPTTPKPKPKDNALSIGSSAGGQKKPNVIDFGNNSELTTTGTGTGSSAGGATTAPPDKQSTELPTQAPVKTQPPTQAPVKTQPPTQAPVKTQPPTQAPVKTQPPTKAPVKTQPPTQPPPTKEIPTQPPTKAPVKTQPPTNVPVKTQPPTKAPVKTQPPTKAPVTTQAPPATTQGTTAAATNATGNNTDSGTGSQPNNSKPPMSGTTASPAGTTSGSGMVGSTAGSGSVSTAGTGAATGSNNGTKNGTSAGTGSGPNSGTTMKVPPTPLASSTMKGPTKPQTTQAPAPTNPPSSKAPVTSAPVKTNPSQSNPPAPTKLTYPNINVTDKYSNTDANNTNTECKDLINCRAYPPEKICVNDSVYKPWASVRCRAYCGYCIQNTSPVPCVDKIPNCNEYDADLCTNPLYRLFREDNCLKFCNLCKGGSPTAPSPGKRDYEKEDETIEFY
ncbi:mucin-2-like isoform X2 [Mytilus californianus]|uniref:mucin-2-like isoform X2 n=1 Tax=Mytilus californianus TaxID=6549 RepID=UPI0022485150|nr:mucin-2-like isoform X2 [Mytilus californianus]